MKGDKHTIVEASWLNSFGIKWFDRYKEMEEIGPSPFGHITFLCDKHNRTWGMITSDKLSWPKGDVTYWRESCGVTREYLSDERVVMRKAQYKFSTQDHFTKKSE